MKAFTKSAKAYFTTFNQCRSHKTDLNLFNASRASARAHLADSAFKFLSLIVSRNDRGFFNAITIDPDFKKLHRYKRWDALLWAIRHSKTAFNTPVAAGLVAMRQQRFDMEEKKRGVSCNPACAQWISNATGTPLQDRIRLIHSN